MHTKITPIRHAIANCSRCDAWVTEGQSTVTVTVSHETWHGVFGETPEVIVDHARAAHIFCSRCAPLFDFKKIAVGRRNTEEDELVIVWAEKAEIEAHRSAAAQDMFVSADTLTDEQIRGWILEQQWKELDAEGFFGPHTETVPAGALSPEDSCSGVRDKLTSLIDSFISPENGMEVMPGKLETCVLIGFMAAGVFSSVDNRTQGFLGGLAFALGFWIFFVLIVVIANRCFFPRHRRAPSIACMLSPFSTGLTLYLLGGWPSVRKV